MPEPLNRLAKEIYGNAVAHGFYDKENPLPERLMLMVSELSEALEEWRDHHGVNEVYYKPENPEKPEGVPIELADCLIRILDFMYANNIDVDAMVKLKMAYNETRPYRHGGKKA